MTWQPPPRPDWVRQLNAHGDSVGGAAALVSLDPEALLDRAREDTGLEDFGDGVWRAPFEVLLQALESECRLHLAGRLLTRTELLRTLRNRLRLADLWRRRPEILAEPVSPPVFVVGSPRSGTSLLHELLACDPGSRAPALWEMHHPVEALTSEALRPTAHEVATFWHALQPEYETMHANSGDGPNECIYITLHEFLSDHWSGCHEVPSYERHLARADHRPAYRYHRRFLQTLQQRARGERWVLKAPSHLFQLPALFEVYPEARIVQTHRDPLKTLPSALSLMGTLRWMRCEESDPVARAPRLARGYAHVYAREIEQRASGALPDDRFVDVRYEDLVADPVGTLAAVYEALGWSLSADVERAVADTLRREPRSAHGRHRYALAEMGLDRGEESARFAFYRERFGLREEP